MVKKKLNFLDLFSGIGGFALGAYWAGMKFNNHFYSEIDKYCIELYQKRFPDSVYLGNIKEIDFENLKNLYPGKWIITGGFPCQDISLAGKGKGLIDEETGQQTRSGLWFEMYKAIRVLRPQFTIIENVGILVNRGLTTILANLAEIGYDAEWQDIRASDMGAPHKRERIWIIAYPNMPRQQKSQWVKKKKGWLTTPSRGNQWKTEPRICRVVNGLSNRVGRLKGLGNSIVPQIAELLFKQIKDYL